MGASVPGIHAAYSREGRGGIEGVVAMQDELEVSLKQGLYLKFRERKCDHGVGDAASLGSGAAKASALRTGSAGLTRSCCRRSRQAGGTQLDQPLSPAVPS